MMRAEIWLAAGVVVVSNLVALGMVALDRRGEPEATLVLTERELQLPPRQAENTALALRLRWIDAADHDRAERWFDRAKLEEVGFDCGSPLTGERLERYRSLPPRKAFAVLEYEGEAWERHRELLEADKARGDATPGAAFQRPPARAPGPRGPAESLEERLAGSRLVVVDVSEDPEALRKRHPDRARSVVVPASVGLVVVERQGGSPYLTGRVISVHPLELSVPSSLRALLEPLRDGGGADRARDPRYTVTVKWGRRGPWITGVQPLKRQG